MYGIDTKCSTLYVDTYISTYVILHGITCMCIYIYISIYICTYVRTYVRTYVCVVTPRTPTSRSGRVGCGTSLHSKTFQTRRFPDFSVRLQSSRFIWKISQTTLDLRIWEAGSRAQQNSGKQNLLTWQAC